METQSIMFSKSLWNPFQARIWLQENGYKSHKIDITDNTIRFRQHAPSSYKKFAVKSLPGGIKLVLGKKR